MGWYRGFADQMTHYAAVLARQQQTTRGPNGERQRPPPDEHELAAVRSGSAVDALAFVLLSVLRPRTTFTQDFGMEPVRYGGKAELPCDSCDATEHFLCALRFAQCREGNGSCEPVRFRIVVNGKQFLTKNGNVSVRALHCLPGWRLKGATRQC